MTPEVTAKFSNNKIWLQTSTSNVYRSIQNMIETENILFPLYELQNDRKLKPLAREIPTFYAEDQVKEEL